MRNDKGNLKIVIAIVVVVIAIILGIILIKRNKIESGPVETIKQEAYEYFNLYALNEKVGVISKDGSVIIEPTYSDIYIPNQSKDVFFCIDENDEYKILNKTGKEIFNEFESVSFIAVQSNSNEMEKKVLSYEKDGRFGLIDYAGAVLTDAIYESVASLTNKPGCILVRKDGLYGVLDSNGKIIIDTKYNTITGDEYSSEKDGYLKTGYIVSNKTSTGILYGYIDYSGKVLVEPKYELISRPLINNTEDTYLVFRENGKRGVIKNSKVVIKPKYNSIIYNNSANIFVVTRSGNYGFYELEGKEILAPDYTSYSVAGNYICVSKNDEMMLYDLHGNLVNKNRYKSIQETGNSEYFIAQDGDGFYSIISKDKEIADDYTRISYAFDNFFVYTSKDGLYGVLNVYSGIEVEAQYDVIIVLENAKALEARKGNKVDIYSSIIEKILTMEDAVVQKVAENYFAVYSDTELKYIDNNGKISENTLIFKDHSLYAYQNEDGKWGFKNKNDEKIVEATYDIVTEMNEYGFAGIKQDGKWGVVNHEGKVIVEPVYEIESYYAPKFIDKYLLEESENISCIEMELKGE